MNYADYKLLCKTCDHILNANNNIYRVSIPLLHVLKEHPFILKRYSFIPGAGGNDADRDSDEGLSRLKKFSSLLAFLSPFGSSATSFKNIQFDKIDVVFVSHLVSANHLDLEDDFYFSEMPRYLRSNGIRPLVVLINHTEKKSKNLSKQAEALEVPTVVVPDKLGVVKEINALFGLTKELVSMRKESNVESGFKKKCLKFSSSFRNATGALFGLRVGQYVHTILKHTRPVAVVTIYEGHAWERLVYHAAASEKILRIGYQHSVVTQHSHAMCRSLGRSYDPDIICASGHITSARLKEKLDKSHTRVATIGASKLSGVKPKTAIESETKTCLVIPEGLYDECEKLFKFTLHYARKQPNVKFIWRLHPQLEFDKVLSEILITKEVLPENIIISSNSLEEDIKISTHAVYRGSTAVVEAIYGGLTPIYLSDNSDMTIDLLYDVGNVRHIVKNFDDFTQVLDAPLGEGVKVLQTYCKEYFSKLDSAALAREIRKRCDHANINC